eukprot:3937256-Rhodomonas_salina.5
MQRLAGYVAALLAGEKERERERESLSGSLAHHWQLESADPGPNDWLWFCRTESFFERFNGCSWPLNNHRNRHRRSLRKQPFFGLSSPFVILSRGSAVTCQRRLVDRCLGVQCPVLTKGMVLSVCYAMTWADAARGGTR